MTKRFCFATGLILTLCSITSVKAADVMLTAFEPFGGDSVNNSMLVMKKLAEKLEAEKVNVTQCVLPVEYDRAAKVALECKNKMERPPALVLSLGVGQCRLAFETHARNLDDSSSPDNAGVLRTGSPIIKGAPESIRHSAPMDLLFYRAPRLGDVRIVASDDMGSYVCNNTGYWLSTEFPLGNSTRFGFVHVPPVTCSAGTRNPELLAEILEKALRNAVPELF